MEPEGNHRDRTTALDADPETGAIADAKPRAAASLTADIVSRGRHRTQEYGEAGLWRGAKAPLPTEEPVRVTFPQAPEASVDRAPEVASSPEEPPIARVSAAPEKPNDRNEIPEAAGPMDELAPLLFVSVALFFAVFLIGLLLF